MQIDVDWVRDVVQAVNKSCVYEVVVENKKGSLRVKKGDGGQSSLQKAASNQTSQIPKAKTRTVISNLIGRVQLGQDVLHPLVQMDDVIQEGQVVAFVQVFDTISPIVSDKAGKVQDICVQNHDKVEYGTVILKLV